MTTFIRSLIPLISASVVFATLSAGGPSAVRAADQPLTEKPLSQISDHATTALGQKALSIRPNDWKHAETPNFVYHYFSAAIAGPVAVEAEFYYRAIARELERDKEQWERKSHVYIFEKDDDWHQFQAVGGLEKWTGGIHAQGQLFIERDPARKFKGNALAHEITHLVVHRFFGEGIPLWLDEGLAEYTASRWYASFWRLRGYNARPRSTSVSSESYLPLATLASLSTYPEQDGAVFAFYAESERLVRFLSAADKHGFLAFLDGMSKGNRFDTALEKGFSANFFNLDALEQEFKPYATKDHAESPD